MTNGNDLAFNAEYMRPDSFDEVKGWQGANVPLTKRELFAAMAMGGLLAGGRLNPEDNAFYALANADSLIERLNVTNPD